MKKIILMVVAGLSTLLLAVHVVHADATSGVMGTATIAVDGDTTDWNSINKTSFGWGQEAAAQSGSTIYLYASENGTLPANSYDVTIDGVDYYLTIDQYSYNVANGQSSTYTLSSWSSNGSVSNVGTATVTNQNGVYTLEASVNATQLNSAYADGTAVTFSNGAFGVTTTAENLALTSPIDTATGGTDDDLTTALNTAASSSSTQSDSSNAVSQATTGDDSSSATDSSLATNNNTSGDLNIDVDGSFSGWSDKTLTDLYSSGDNYNRKQGTLLADDNDIYFYLNMAPDASDSHQGGYNTVQASNYALTIGGKTLYVTLIDPKTGSQVDVNSIKAGDTKEVEIQIYDSSQSWPNSTYIVSGAKAYINSVAMDDNGDFSQRLEFEIPIDQITGISDTADQTITIANNAIWNGSLETTGGSTGPVVLASAGFAIAIFSVLKMTGQLERLRKKFRIMKKLKHS